MLKLLKRVSQIGVEEDYPNAQKLSYEVCNIICLLTLLISSFYAVLFLFTPYKDQSIVFSISIVITLYTFYSTSKKRQLQSNIVVTANAVILVFYTVLYSGFESQAHCILTTLVVCSFMLFQNYKHAVVSTIIISLLFIFSYYYVNTYGAINPTSRIYPGEYINYLFAIAGSALLSYILIGEVKSYIDKIENSLRINEFKNKQLLEKNTYIENQNKNLELFTSVVSHDLRTPLRNISSFVGLIKRRLKGTDKKINEYVDYTQKGISQMQELINSITYLNRLDLENGEEEVDLDLNQLCHDVIKNFNPELFPGLIVNYSELPTIKVKYSHFYNVFQNLIENAWKYNHHDNRIVNISSKLTENYIELKISDNGIGIDKEYSEQIFNAFERLHSNSEYYGSGMGLFICKKTISLYEGTMRLGKEDMAGSTFLISLPINVLSHSDQTVLN